MTCEHHLWLPKRSMCWHHVWCRRCGEARRVRSRWVAPKPRSIGDALAEAIDRDVIANTDVAWGGQRLR